MKREKPKRKHDRRKLIMENEKQTYDLLVEINERLKRVEETLAKKPKLKEVLEISPPDNHEEIDWSKLKDKEFTQETDLTNLWNATLAAIAKKISKPSFETWIKSTKVHSLQDNVLIVTAKNEFARDWLEERYSSLITDTLYEITRKELSVKFKEKEDSMQNN